ncbi:TPA: diphthine synthase [Candidatus Woesearchaeota archaeon]|nr:diphthine synthase [Candidatus Woesearchaeota archaeon]
MTLYLIGLGLHDEKDISVKGLEIVKRCDVVYVDTYTSLLQCSREDLEKFYGRKVIPAPREVAEQHEQEIITQAKTKEVAFLVVGDPFAATTHVELLKQAQEQGVNVKIIHNASILTAIGITGLQLYKFGRTISIPFLEDHPHLETPYIVLRQNLYLDMHTVFLLDLKPELKKFMTIPEALTVLETIEERKKEHVITPSMMVIGCARLGADDMIIKAGSLEKIKEIDFGKPPFCLIVPGKLHFVEREMIERYAIR